MAHILNTVMGNVTVQTETVDANGNPQTTETQQPVVKEVTFMLDRSTPHTLKFLDKGTKIKDGNGVERVVGEGTTAYHEFATAENAVAAYLDGKV